MRDEPQYGIQHLRNVAKTRLEMKSKNKTNNVQKTMPMDLWKTSFRIYALQEITKAKRALCELSRLRGRALFPCN